MEQKPLFIKRYIVLYPPTKTIPHYTTATYHDKDAALKDKQAIACIKSLLKFEINVYCGEKKEQPPAENDAK